MAIRLSGMSSGLDTDSIIKELMKAQSLKKTKIEQKKTKLEWTQDKWKDLNTKIYNLYTNQVSKMRLQSTYKIKSVASSDETKVMATAGPNAATGSHTISVNQLASAQYLTSNKVSLPDGKAVNGTTKLTEMGFNVDGTNTVINISGTENSSYIVTADSTVSDLIGAFQKAGLNASFDSTQQRFFISSRSSGASQQFSITTSTISNDFVADRDNLRTIVGYDSMVNADKDKVENALKAFNYGGNGGTVSMGSLNKEQTDAHLVLVDLATKAAKNQTATEANQKVRDAVIENEFGEKTQEAVIKEAMTKSLTAANPSKTSEEIEKMVDDQYATMTEEDRKVTYDKIIDAKVAEVKTQDSYQKIYNDYITNNEGTNITNRLTQLDDKLVEYAANSGQTEYASGSTPMSYLGMAEINLAADANGVSRVQINGASGSMSTSDTTNVLQYGGMSLVGAQDAIFVLDGAELTSQNNSFSVNNLSLDLKGVTSSPVSLNITNDTKGAYDSVKEFVTEYNKVLKEMNELYFAASAKG